MFQALPAAFIKDFSAYVYALARLESAHFVCTQGRKGGLHPQQVRHGTYLEHAGTLAYFQLPSEAKLRAFYTAANMARRELKLPTWPDFVTWARANRITVVG